VAQERGPIDATVVQIAGEDVYVDVGENAGLAPGDTVTVADAGGRRLGRMVVQGATPTRASLHFLDSPFALTRGVGIRIATDGSTGAPARADSSATGDAGGGRKSAASRSARGPRTSGRLSLEVDAFRTETEWAAFDVPPVSRDFVTPAMGLRLRTVGLPGGFEFRTSLRASYRSSSDDLVAPDALVRVYSLSMHREFGRGEVAFGRLYNPFEPGSGFFDGLYVHYGDRGPGAGVAVGFQPDRADAGPSTDAPKLSVFATYDDRSGPLRYRGAASVTHVRPSDRPDHTYLGLTQAVRAGRVRLTQSVQVDRETGMNRWVVSRLTAGASLPVTDAVDAHLRWSLRQPYDETVAEDLVTWRRDLVGGGLSWSLARGWLGLDATHHRVEGGESGWAWSGSAAFPETGLARIGVDASVTWWDETRRNVLTGTAGVSRAFGAARLRGSYQLYRSRELDGFAESVSHTAEVGGTAPIGGGLFGSVRLRQRFGSVQRGTFLYAGLWLSF
jgi:hypothetical protein